MKLKKKIFIVLLSIILVFFLINVLLGWVPIPWSTTVYTSTYDNLIPIWDANYQKLLVYNAADCWDDLLVDVRTSSEKDSSF